MKLYRCRFAECCTAGSSDRVPNKLHSEPKSKGHKHCSYIAWHKGLPDMMRGIEGMTCGWSMDVQMENRDRTNMWEVKEVPDEGV
jgi:hypothetical protein